VKFRVSPYKVTQNVVLGTINAYSTKELAFAITEMVGDINKEVSANPTFALPDGLIYTVFNRDIGYIRLRVANITANPIVVPDGNWIFKER
jgi:hypothetical protein